MFESSTYQVSLHTKSVVSLVDFIFEYMLQVLLVIPPIDGAYCDENFTSLFTGADGLLNKVFRSEFRNFLLFETIIDFEFIFSGVKLLSWHLFEAGFDVCFVSHSNCILSPLHVHRAC